MAYRRPLTRWQMLLFAGGWLALAVWIVRAQGLQGPTLLVLALSAFLVFYPIVKSWRQRRGK